MGVLADPYQHRLDLESAEDIAVGGITGDGESDPITGLESGEES